MYLILFREQNLKIAGKLGLKEAKFTKQDKYSRKEDNLEEESTRRKLCWMESLMN